MPKFTVKVFGKRDSSIAEIIQDAPTAKDALDCVKRKLPFFLYAKNAVPVLGDSKTVTTPKVKAIGTKATGNKRK